MLARDAKFSGWRRLVALVCGVTLAVVAVGLAGEAAAKTAGKAAVKSGQHMASGMLLPREGDFELRLDLAPGGLGRLMPRGIGLSSLNGFGYGIGVNAGVGYFIRDNIEVGGGSGIGFSGGENQDLAVTFPLVGFWRWLWPMNERIMLWAGNNLGFVYSAGAAFFMIGAQGGAEFFIMPKWSLWPQVYFHLFAGGGVAVDGGIAYGTSIYF